MFLVCSQGFGNLPGITLSGRSPYNHFPRICKLLHFLILKLYPSANAKRGKASCWCVYLNHCLSYVASYFYRVTNNDMLLFFGSPKLVKSWMIIENYLLILCNRPLTKFGRLVNQMETLKEVSSFMLRSRDLTNFKRFTCIVGCN